MSRRSSRRPSNRQILAAVAIILAVIALLPVPGPWLVAAVILLAVAQFI